MDRYEPFINALFATQNRRSALGAYSIDDNGDITTLGVSSAGIQAQSVGVDHVFVTGPKGALEIFFRFFKHVLGCRHLLSHRADGIKIQVYMAIIACMLITLWSGRKPTLRTGEMMQFYFTGWATEEELDAHIAKLKKQDK